MKAILYKDKKPVLCELPRPEPQDGEVLIKVHAAALNRADLLQREGNYPPPPGVTQVPGLEVAGTVEACPSGKLKKGEKVCALLPGGVGS